MKKLLNFINYCENNRKTGFTDSNSKSSRSHGLIKIKNFKSTLNIIDLAGSEKQVDLKIEEKKDLI